MDDGLLVNFSSEGPAKVAATQTKGHWRDRRKSLKQARKQAGLPSAPGRKPKQDNGPPFRRPLRSATSANAEPIKERKRSLPDGDSDLPAKAAKLSAASSSAATSSAAAASSSSSAATASAATAGSGSARAKPAPAGSRAPFAKEADGDTFISSLFTATPDIEGTQETVAKESSNAPLGDGTFAGLGLPPALCRQLASQSIDRPTNIQRMAIPQLAAAKDTLVIAQTGSGKTLAYLLPMLASLISQPDLSRTSGLFGIIMVPTRELATQIYQVLESLVRCCHWIVPGIVIGGEKRKSEKARLRKGVNILVGTPGRLSDHLDNTKSVDLKEIRWVILDEGDRLVELGFEETLSSILDKISSASRVERSRYRNLPLVRAHVLCSATMTASTERLRTLTLTNPVWVQESQDSLERAPDQLQQTMAVVPAKLRLVTLAAELKAARRAARASDTKSGKAVVFFSCSDSVDFHYSAFTYGAEDEDDSDASGDDSDNSDREDVGAKPKPVKIGAPGTQIGADTTVFKLHGSLSQPQRAATISAFAKCAGFAVLMATDVASRGLDSEVDRVVEFDPPFQLEDHIHRVGRTARAGRKGQSVLFLLPGAEEKYVEKLESAHPGGIQLTGYGSLLKAAFGANWESAATTWQLGVERWLLQSPRALEQAKKAFTAHIRAYTTHVAPERVYFAVKGLHLGHIAKAFGLRETPGGMGGQPREKKPKKSNKNVMFATARQHMKIDEYNVA